MSLILEASCTRKTIGVGLPKNHDQSLGLFGFKVCNPEFLGFWLDGNFV